MYLMPACSNSLKKQKRKLWFRLSKQSFLSLWKPLIVPWIWMMTLIWKTLTICLNWAWTQAQCLRFLTPHLYRNLSPQVKYRLAEREHLVHSLTFKKRRKRKRKNQAWWPVSSFLREQSPVEASTSMRFRAWRTSKMEWTSMKKSWVFLPHSRCNPIRIVQFGVLGFWGFGVLGLMKPSCNF